MGKNVQLDYGGLGIVIHPRVIIGDNVQIGTSVTIGSTKMIAKVPAIGENTLISTGAKIIGPVQVGKNCVIRANAVVTKNVPNNCVAVGVPARIIKKDIEITDYRKFIETNGNNWLRNLLYIILILVISFGLLFFVVL